MLLLSINGLTLAIVLMHADCIDKTYFFKNPDSTWEFLRLILDLSMKVLKQDGKYFTQVVYLTILSPQTLNNHYLF